MKKNGDNKKEDIRFIRGGFQHKKTEKSEAQNPPSGDSNVNKPKSSNDKDKE